MPFLLSEAGRVEHESGQAAMGVVPISCVASGWDEDLVDRIIE